MNPAYAVWLTLAGFMVISLTLAWIRALRLIGAPRSAPDSRPCAHWPRDPVILFTGEEVAFICRKCGHAETSEQWIRGAVVNPSEVLPTGVIKTAAAGKRVEIGPNGVTYYRADGSVKLHIPNP